MKHNGYPNVSVIILTYNGADYILPLLKSLAEQTYPLNFVEIVVIDNASTDNTLKLVQNHYRTVKIIPLKKNIGFFSQHSPRKNLYSQFSKKLIY